jgi:hypothetical protein
VAGPGPVGSATAEAAARVAGGVLA